MTPEERRAIIVQRVADLDKLEPQVRITLGGSTYTLELDNTAVKALFRRTGVNMLQNQHFTKMDDPEFVEELMVAALMKHHPEMTLDKMGEFLNFTKSIVWMGALRQVSFQFMPDTKDLPRLLEDGTLEGQEKMDPTKKPNGVGSAIGLSPLDSDYLGVSSESQP